MDPTAIRRKADEGLSLSAEVVIGNIVGDMPFSRFHLVQWVACCSTFAAAATTAATMPWMMQGVRGTLHLSAVDEGALSACIYWGMALGSIGSSWVADTFGRRSAVIASLLLLAILEACVGQLSTATTIAIAFVARGMVYMTCENVAKAQLAECIPIKHRGLLLNTVHAAWQVGGVIGTAYTVATIEYTPLSLLAAVGPFCAMLLCAAVSIESPMWLLRARGRDAAEASVRKIGARCGAHMRASIFALQPEATLELATVPTSAERGAGSTRGGGADSSGSNDGMDLRSGSDRAGNRLGLSRTWTARNPSGGSSVRSDACDAASGWHMLQLFGERYRMLTLATASVWLCLASASLSNDFLLIRFLQRTDRARLQRPLMFTQYGFKLVGSVLGGGLIDRFGRKRVLAPSFILTAVGTWVMVSAPTDAAVYLSAALLYTANEILWATVNTFTCEAFPTQVRSSAIGFCVAIGRLSAAASVGAGPTLMDCGSRVPYALNALVLVLGGLLSSRLPAETSGKALV